MTDIPHDPLLERLRLADPAATLGTSEIPSHDQITAARRRRAGHRARLVSSAGVLAGIAAVLVAAFAPSGSLDRTGILTRAADASKLPGHSIVVLDSVLTLDSNLAHVERRSTTWMLTTRSGRIATFRYLVTQASGSGLGVRGLEETGPGNAHPRRGGLDVTYDPRTGRTKTLHVLSSLPSTALAVQVHKLLLIASHARRAQGALNQQGSYLRFVVRGVVHRGVTDPGGLHTLREIRLDPKTYAPIMLRNEESTRIHGKPVFTRTVERIISKRVLPDTPANRRLLMLRGPIR